MKRTCLAAALLSVFLWSGHAPRAADKPAPLDVELEDLRPGLVAVYRSLADKDAVVQRIDPKPAFTLGHSSPHPRLGPGAFEAVWTGVLFLKETAPITFDAFVGGELTIEVDGVTVLQGRGTSDTAKVAAKEPLNRPLGLYRLKITYKSLPDVPARLQIWWQGASFSREPLPAWQLKHLATDVSADGRRDELAEQGRKAAERFGCARCHAGAFPGVSAAPPGPSLADAGRRVDRTWLLHWLADPAKLRPDAHMPALFADDRTGFVERWLLAEHLGTETKPAEPKGDHRAGRLAFYNFGCAACHIVPDIDRKEQKGLDRYPLVGLAERLPAEDLASFLGNPHSRYPDGRMPRLPLPPGTARDIAAYLLLWSPAAKVGDGMGKLGGGRGGVLDAPDQASDAGLLRRGFEDSAPATQESAPNKSVRLETPAAPTAAEIDAVAKRLKVRGAANAATALLRERNCTQCHPGLGTTQASDIPIKDSAAGCLAGKAGSRFALTEHRPALAAYLKVAPREKHASPFEARRRQVDRAGCVRCHQRDSDRPPPLEEVGSTLGGAFLQYLPFQRTPKLSNPHLKYHRAYLAQAVREGVSGLRPTRYSYRMPAFGHDAETLLQAMAEGDGELIAGVDPPTTVSTDPTLATLSGPALAGFTGYSCVSCHLWNGQALSEPDPGAVGPDLTKVQGRIRRDWFDRFLEDPARIHPGTPMPGIFPKGKPATLTSVLDGDPAKQREALWAYLLKGKDAPSPKPPPPLVVTAPDDTGPLVAQVPIRTPTGTVESISVLFGSADLLVYDVGSMAPHSFTTGAQILRNVQGRLRSYTATGTPGSLAAEQPFQLLSGEKPESPKALVLHGYDRLADGVRLRWRADFPAGPVEVTETFRLSREGKFQALHRELTIPKVPQGCQVQVRSKTLGPVDVKATVGAPKVSLADVFQTVLTPGKDGSLAATITYELPAAKPAPAIERVPLTDAGKIEGSLERPGYRAIAYPRPKTAAGDDLVMPGAVAAHPRDGRVFVASMKAGEVFVLRDPADDGKNARFDNYAHGLFQEAYSMLAEDDGLYVLHRRNLTKIVESKRDGSPDRFERVFALPHGVADTYDYGYGLVRDRSGAFVLSYAPYANTTLPGSGGAIRWKPGRPPEEIAYGFRNPVGWTTGPDGEVFYTDNQGEWVATNKLCHVAPGRYYGFPNQAQKEHASKPAGKTTIWVPYAWARSINGVTYDASGGKFGPFAGQFFLAELMYGGAIVRANVEKVNGVYQGACFPFWGKGLLGPVTLAFDPKGRLFVGGITEPGWMAQPDRGALFRIDYAGQAPFEMQSITVQPRGFRISFTRPVDPKTAEQLGAYQLEHYRYEYTGAYGSPELDRTRVPVEKVVVAADGLSAELTVGALVKERVYMIGAPGVRSAKGETLVHQTGAYTLNEVPAGK